MELMLLDLMPLYVRIKDDTEQGVEMLVIIFPRAGIKNLATHRIETASDRPP
jgi:hypothetical protein